ncbi:hypothetical protein [Mycetocola spongiae]|uniref:hypothetical protein n=1 Tax=Mycetocola spongiae TaxID=2859226 RepID=UPI001CF2C4E2|nr:hypothetical protein [Mycetocola spongiae]UCR89268.1 hypothetical protein KXZ72_00700 [Mycetocola spongiae]
MTKGPGKREWVGSAIFVGVILVAAWGARIMMAGGDLGCAFAEDPALCATVKGLGL